MRTLLILLFLLAASQQATATTLSLKSEIVGAPAVSEPIQDEDLEDIARKHDVGHDELKEANKGSDPSEQDTIMIPSQWILPSTLNLGEITINLAEKRLYYPYEEKGVLNVATFPIATGKDKTPTPAGSYKVIEKIANPAWNVPKSIRREKPSLPAVVPPGPKNPLGPRALRLTNAGLMIHGTNAPASIGRRDSHGCIRLYPEDIKSLYKLVKIQTPVHIVREAVKMCYVNGRLYMQAYKHPGIKAIAQDLITSKNYTNLYDKAKLQSELDNPSGLPVDITLEQPLETQLIKHVYTPTFSYYNTNNL